MWQGGAHLWHDCDALGVDGAQVCVLKETGQVGLRRLLQGVNGHAAKAQVDHEVLRNLADEALERELADEEVRRLLILADLAERHRARAVPVRLLHATRQRGGLARSLDGEVLARGLATRRLARRLLCTCHGCARAV